MKTSPIVSHGMLLATLLAVALVSTGCRDNPSEPNPPAEQSGTPLATDPQQPPTPSDPLPPADPPVDPEVAPVAPSEIDPDPIPIPTIPSPLDLTPPDEPGMEPPPATDPDTLPGLALTGREEGTVGGDLTGNPPVDPPPTPPQPDLATALADEVEGLARLDPVRSVWFDKANGRVVVLGRICQREAWLELFACLSGTKEHEAIVSADALAYTVHAGLLALGATAGQPATWTPEYTPASGTQIEVTVVWKDESGTRKTARAQDWILDVTTQQAMTHPWVLAGSRFWYDEATDTRHYQAEGGDFICVSNFPTAMLDLPIQSSDSNDALQFRAFTERIPPLGTPVALLLTPKVEAADPPEAGAEEDAAEE